MKARRILHVSTTINRGGAENHLFDLVQHQREAGMNVAVAYLRGNHRELNVPAHHLALRFYGDLRPLMRLRSLIAEFQPELVHAHLPPGELYARLALLGTPASALPLIISKHNDCPFHRIPGQRALGRWVAGRAAAVIAISDAVRRYMTGPALGLRPDTVHRIYYGIDVRPFEHVTEASVATLRQEWGAGADTLVVGFAGRLVEQKAIDTLIRAFGLFVARTPCPAKLVIAGYGPLEATLRKCADEAGVADRMVWAGFREDVPRLMRAFDVFAITSVHEGFGLVLVEAMAAKRPVVATRAGAIPEVVVDGETGLLTDPQEPQQIADALGRMTQPALRAQWGAAGYRRVLAHFTLERMWEQTDALYATCLRPDGARSTVKSAAALPA